MIMANISAKYGYTPDKEAIGRHLELIASNLETIVSTEVYKECFSIMDLTTLKNTDTPPCICLRVSQLRLCSKRAQALSSDAYYYCRRLLPDFPKFS